MFSIKSICIVLGILPASKLNVGLVFYSKTVSSVVLFFAVILCSACDGDGISSNFPATAENHYINPSNISYQVFSNGNPISAIQESRTYPETQIIDVDFNGVSSVELRYFVRSDIAIGSCVNCCDDEFCHFASLQARLPVSLPTPWQLDPLDTEYICNNSASCDTNEFVIHSFVQDSSQVEIFQVEISEEASNVPQQIRISNRLGAPDNLFRQIPDAIPFVNDSSDDPSLSRIGWVNVSNESDSHRWYTLDAIPAHCGMDRNSVSAVEIKQRRNAFPENVFLVHKSPTGWFALEPPNQTLDDGFYRNSEIRDFNILSVPEVNDTLEIFLVRDGTVGWARVYEDASDFALDYRDLPEGKFCDVNLTTPMHLPSR